MRRKNKPYFSIVMPVFNEEKLLRKSIRTLLAGMNKLKQSYEVLIIENGSTDGTPRIADKLAESRHLIRVIHLPSPDYGQALYTGHIMSRGTIEVNFSADWIDFEFFKQALVKMAKYDIVMASKHIQGSIDRRPFVRRFGGFFFHTLVQKLFSFSLYDTHGIKVFRRGVIIKLAKLCRSRHEIFDTELVIRAFRQGIRICELPARVLEHRSPRVNIVSRAIKGFIQLIYLRFIFWRENISL